MTANKNNTISSELKEEIYRISSKLLDAQSNINDTYKYLLKNLLGLGYTFSWDKRTFADTPQTKLMTNKISQTIYALKEQTSEVVKMLEKLQDKIKSEENNNETWWISKNGIKTPFHWRIWGDLYESRK